MVIVVPREKPLFWHFFFVWFHIFLNFNRNKVTFEKKNAEIEKEVENFSH